LSMPSSLLKIFFFEKYSKEKRIEKENKCLSTKTCQFYS